MRGKLRGFIPVFLFCFLLAGCSGQTQPQLKQTDLLFSFQCKAEVTAGQQKYSCILIHSAPGIGSVQVTSGDLEGLLYNWSGENFSISYNGVAADSETCVLPKTSFAYLLQSVIDNAQKNGGLTRTHGNEFSGAGEGYDFMLAADGATGQIQKISIPKYEISADFSEYSELGI